MARHGHQVVYSELTPFDLWGSNGWCNQQVVGESHYLPALRRILPHGGRWREELELSALLVPEPANRHDPNAVAVRVDGSTVGYLPKEVAARYQPMLLDLARRELVARVPCRVWGGTFDGYDDGLAVSERFNASVTLALAEPHLCVPVNTAPVRHMLLPRGAAIQVTGEERYMPAIAPFLRPEGECLAYSTLHETDETVERGAKERVEVRLDDQCVGLLTPKMSGDLLPAVRHLSGAGYVTAAMARVKGNGLKAEVTLYCLRAHELADEWLSSVREAITPPENQGRTEPHASRRPFRHGVVPPKPSRIRFAAPPGWPAPPFGWEPPIGWEPDPAWPPAPPDWHYWVAE